MAATLSAAEAARALGVKKATLYTYVSRGWLRAVREGRASRYLTEDVESMRLRAAAAHGHDAAAASALDWGAPILESAITSIDADGPWYRARNAVELALRDVPFEAVFELLVDEVPPAGRHPVFAPAHGPFDAVAGDSLFARLAASVALYVARDELRLGTTGEVERRRRRELARRVIAGCGAEPAALAAPSLGEALAVALGAPPSSARWLSRAMVVCADHELNASTFAARVAAGTGADTGSCVLAALAALSGPRHGGATVQVVALLRPVVDDGSARRALTGALASGGAVPGFGHRLYPDGDPRAAALLAWATEVDPAATAPVARFAALATDATGSHPTLDLGLAALARALRLPEHGAPAMFAAGRVAGWIAHVDEQRKSGRMLRPRAAPPHVSRPTTR
jgi:citrate synthase